MGDLAIRVENLSKRYQIGAARRRHDTLRDQISEKLHSLFDSRGLHPQRSEIIWALRDVSFQVKKGEVVGIIGRNGSGKSTLLKILARITAPTRGYAEMRGRLGSLLEVGTGFHAELSGRDNIYLNGAVLGMKKTEIDRKFDEIVAFAEIEKFIDTPVKRYSSGMYVRLAFAVAAHLEPELLILDEVLAVGDVEFQKKCLGKMHDISRNQGRTILFVSHNIDAIQRLCPRCLLIDKGQLIANGDTPDVVGRYLSEHCDRARPNEWIDLSQMNRSGTGHARFVAAQYSSPNADVASHAYADGPLEFRLSIESDECRTIGSLAVTLYSHSGSKLVNADTVSLGQSIRLQKGRNLVKLRIHKLYLNPGVYVVGFWLANPISARRSGGEYDHVQSAFEIDVVEYSSARFGSRSKSDGLVTCHFDVVDAA